MSYKRYELGFNLIELMIVVAISSIIAMVAIPAYQDSVIKGKRTEGQAALVNMANRIEKYFYDNNSYVGATATGLMGSSATESGYYQLQISVATATAYTLQAQPAGNFDDAYCQTLTLDHSGTKGVAGGATKPASECW
ncbi:MAG: type IV pilin protein [Gammaproteobacteria bacterium]|nr:type IV pilin protein [Gammaproteobacteria bacterium]